ncbi:MAG: YidB family protein [Betaproteobacteria bacterium]|nr:YidB family protein [Betaproteobacteria bacterium]
MGLLDQIAGAMGGSAGAAAEGESSLLGNIMHLVNNPETGGLSGLVQSFQKGGLGEVINSWVSTGQNLPISSEQIQSILGSEQVSQIAGKLGISPEEASGKLAEFLPQIVDKLTPNGSVPEGSDLMSTGLELLKSKLFG